MILISKTYWGGVPFDFKRPPDAARVESLVLRADDFRQCRGLYWTQAANPEPRVAVVCMHPRVDFTHHYCIPRLVAAGIGVLAANTRNPNNDIDTVHEEIILDVAACVRYLREKRGVDKVVLFGNSGGGSLSAFYQAQARLQPAERLETTPAGQRTRLGQASMSPADGMVYVSAHRGQGKVLLECIDPSVCDERDPFATDPALDMYASDNGFVPPPTWCEYAPEFVERYRAAQRARVERLDRTARELLGDAAQAAERAREPGFDELDWQEQRRVLSHKVFEPLMVIYRTMANLHYVDRHLDPSPRDYGSLLSERPDLMNMKLLGFARVCTPRAWLSTWSGLSSNADLVRNLRHIAEPTLVVNAGRDREIYPRTNARPIFEAVAAGDRTFLEFDQARHYFEPEPGEKDAPDVRAPDGCGGAVDTGAVRVTARHPTTRNWVLPPGHRAPVGGGLRRTNLRELEARPGRFEHHLMVVARVGGAQLEVATASEPLYFAHANISDEYAMAMSTGDEPVDAFPYRTFLSDPASFEDVGRINSRVRDMVLHPYGLLHWPGRLRPPYAPFAFGPGERRSGYTLVMCATRPVPPSERPLFVSDGREADTKAYTGQSVPFLLADTRREGSRLLGGVAAAKLELVVSPSRISPPRGGYAVVLDGDEPHFPGDLVYIPAGDALAAAGIGRALVVSSDTSEPEPPPGSWDTTPDAPFPTFEDGAAGTLPLSVAGLSLERISADRVRVEADGSSTEVPRYWLARFLFRLGLHGYCIGYLETYGGFFYDDRDGYRLGIRGGGEVKLEAAEVPEVVERLYRSVAPQGYVERID